MKEIGFDYEVHLTHNKQRKIEEELDEGIRDEHERIDMAGVALRFLLDKVINEHNQQVKRLRRVERILG